MGVADLVTKAINEQRDKPFTALILSTLIVVTSILWSGRNDYANAQTTQSAVVDQKLNKLEISLQRLAKQNRLNQIDDILFTLNQEAKKLAEHHQLVNEDLARRIYDLTKEREQVDYDLKQLK